MSSVVPPPPYTRPSLLGWVRALRVTDPKYPWVAPTWDEENIATLLEVVEEEHFSTAAEPDNAEWLSPWGTCESCRQSWPCPSWVAADRTGQRWVGYAHERYASHARDARSRGGVA